MTFRIGVIGCGWIANSCHGPAYREYASLHPQFELAACCDTEAVRAETFRSAFGFKKAYQNFEEMLEAEQFDAVCLNVPPALICEIGCAVLRRRIPLLSEKPPGLTTRELDRLIETARENRVPHQVAFNRRFAPLMTELKKRLAGLRTSHFDYTLTRVGRNHEDFSTTAIHAIDTTRFLAGVDFAEVRIAYQEEQGVNGPFFNYQVNGMFTSGASFHITICPSSGVSIERAAIYCQDQAFILTNNLGPDIPGRLQHYEKDQLITDIDAAACCGRVENYYLSGFYAEDSEFFDRIQAGLPFPNDFPSAYQPVAVMEALRDRKVTLDLTTPSFGP